MYSRFKQDSRFKNQERIMISFILLYGGVVLLDIGEGGSWCQYLVDKSARRGRIRQEIRERRREKREEREEEDPINRCSMWVIMNI